MILQDVSTTSFTELHTLKLSNCWNQPVKTFHLSQSMEKILEESTRRCIFRFFFC